MPDNHDNNQGDNQGDNRLTGRLWRYARVAGSAGGVAARIAGEKMLGISRADAARASDLRAILGNLKGPVMKVAQMLATIPGALPTEYARELTQLQSNAPAMGWPFVKRRMRHELGPDWQNLYASFSPEAQAAASLGQVHRATGQDGRALAVKLQYPDMSSAVEADLGQLNLILGLFRRYDASIDTREIRLEIADRLREELDYDLEARHMRLFAHMLQHETGIHVPGCIESLSTDRLLTMDWLSGQPLTDYFNHSLEDRNQIAFNLFRAWYTPFHHYGVIHGDPHLGNYTVRDDLGLNLLDFGCVRKFSPRFVGGVVDLYHALQNNDPALAVHAYESWGFQGLSKDLIETLNIWAAFLYGPLTEDRTRLINVAENPVDYGREQAIKVRQRLKELGPVTPPREFVFMDRAAISLGGVFLRLGAQLNWHRLFQDIIEGHDNKILAERQQHALQLYGLKLQPPTGLTHHESHKK